MLCYIKPAVKKTGALASVPLHCRGRRVVFEPFEFECEASILALECFIAFLELSLVGSKLLHLLVKIFVLGLELP
jgi:hypothetical protein